MAHSARRGYGRCPALTDHSKLTAQGLKEAILASLEG